MGVDCTSKRAGQVKIYMRVSDDEYRLPIAWGETYRELAGLLGLSRDTVKNSFMRLRSGRVKDSLYVEVDIGDEDLHEGN